MACTAACVPPALPSAVAPPARRSLTADTLCMHLTNAVGPLAARTASEILKGMGALRAVRHALALPLYVHHGSDDK